MSRLLKDSLAILCFIALVMMSGGDVVAQSRNGPNPCLKEQTQLNYGYQEMGRSFAAMAKEKDAQIAELAMQVNQAVAQNERLREDVKKLKADLKRASATEEPTSKE